MMHLTEKRIDGETLYQGRIITVEKDRVQLEDGTLTSREVVRHNGGCGVVALDGAGNVLLVRQFRYPYAAQTLELPAGKLDKPGEAADEAIKRELSEETGHTADRWFSLGLLYPTPGYCDEKLYIYAATGLHQTSGQHTDDGEFVDVVRMPLSEAVEKALSGEIRDAKTVAGLLKVQLLLQSGRLTV